MVRRGRAPLNWKIGCELDVYVRELTTGFHDTEKPEAASVSGDGTTNEGQGPVSAFDGCDVSHEVASVGGSLSLPFRSSEGFLVI